MLREKPFFLEGTDGLCAYLKLHFFAIYFDCFTLKIWFPNLFGVALRKADITAVLLAFAGKFAFLHYISPNSRSYCIVFVLVSQRSDWYTRRYAWN